MLMWMDRLTKSNLRRPIKGRTKEKPGQGYPQPKSIDEGIDVCMLKKDAKDVRQRILLVEKCDLSKGRERKWMNA